MTWLICQTTSQCQEVKLFLKNVQNFLVGYGNMVIYLKIKISLKARLGRLQQFCCDQQLRHR